MPGSSAENILEAISTNQVGQRTKENGKWATGFKFRGYFIAKFLRHDQVSLGAYLIRKVTE
jgi:hypothetical protein